jgi:hypothetical protein
MLPAVAPVRRYPRERWRVVIAFARCGTRDGLLPRLLAMGRWPALLAVLVLGTPAVADPMQTPDQKAVADLRDDSSPWGVASGAEWFSAYPIFNPLLKQAGVRWLRGFYEWQTIQPRQGSWNFTLPDRLLKDAQANAIHLTGVLAYLAPWASADGGTRRFPIKNIQFWRDYVAGMVARYQSDIKYWEVWNEFNGSFAENGTPALYAELVREASLAAKRVDPSAKIGLSVANFDVRFIDAAIKAGAGDHFDYICVHPYEILERLSDRGEPAFLSMATTLRTMLQANHQPDDIPLWITEVGAPAPINRDDIPDKVQAAQLAKAYLLAIASGFRRVFWFEARGPSYGNSGDLGLIRSDMTPRPSYDALSLLTRTLGPEPRPAGWLELGEGGYGFLFDTQDGTVLAAWSPGTRDITLTFEGNVQLSTLTGEQLPLPAGKPFALTSTPVLIGSLPPALVAKARSQQPMPYPWGGDHSGAAIVTAQLKAANVESGVRQVRLDTTVADAEWRRTDLARADGEGHYVYLWVDPQFTPPGTTALEITAVVRRTAPYNAAGMIIDYESNKGYVGSEYRTIPDGDGWQELSWTIQDANFIGAWGWHFRLNAISSPNDFLVKEIRVRKIG